MLKDIIEAQTKKAREQSKPVSHTISSDGTTNSDGFFEVTGTYVQINLSDINTLITETAQIVAREVLRKVREGYGDEREFEIQPDGEYHFGANQKVIGWNKARLAYLTYLQSLENELSEVLSK